MPEDSGVIAAGAIAIGDCRIFVFKVCCDGSLGMSPQFRNESTGWSMQRTAGSSCSIDKLVHANHTVELLGSLLRERSRGSILQRRVEKSAKPSQNVERACAMVERDSYRLTAPAPCRLDRHRKHGPNSIPLHSTTHRAEEGRTCTHALRRGTRSCAGTRNV